MSGINFNFGTGVSRPSTGGNMPSVQSGSTQNAQSAQSAAPKTPTSDISYQNASPQTVLNTLTERMFSKGLTLNSLDAKQFAMLVKEMLSMPKEMQALLALLAMGESDPAQWAKMFKDQKIKVLLSDLQQLLGNNSKDVLNRLIHLTQNNALFFEGNQQFRDIMGFIQKITVLAQASPSDALMATMMLYLPWLPLAEQQKLELTFGFQEPTDEEKAGEDVEVLILFISTRTVGTFKITILLHKDKTLEILIENDHAATCIISALTKKINEELGQYGLKSNISTATRKETETRTPKQMKSENSKSISIHPSGKISAITVNTGYTISKIIFSFDERTEVTKIREEKIK